MNRTKTFLTNLPGGFCIFTVLCSYFCHQRIVTDFRKRPGNRIQSGSKQIVRPQQYIRAMILTKQTWYKDERPGEQYTRGSNNMPGFSSSVRRKRLPHAFVMPKTNHERTSGHNYLRNAENHSSSCSG